MELPGWVTVLPAVNASLNGLALLLLLTGYTLIRQGKQSQHKRVMLCAFATSIAFLGCYLVYHFALSHYTGEPSKRFPGTGGVKYVYYTILISHVLLAAAVPVLALMTIYRAWKQDWPRHRRIARLTFPIWVYVSATGVIIYLMVYHWPVLPPV
jgi:protein SCO1/2/putative membrane protein